MTVVFSFSLGASTGSPVLMNQDGSGIYNRVVWGVLYHETFPEIKYGFTEEVRTNIRKELEQALQYENSNW